MMAPQVAQEGESPISYMDFMASEAWSMPPIVLENRASLEDPLMR
jgi:hypothetical protein